MRRRLTPKASLILGTSEPSKGFLQSRPTTPSRRGFFFCFTSWGILNWFCARQVVSGAFGSVALCVVCAVENGPKYPAGAFFEACAKSIRVAFQLRYTTDWTNQTDGLGQLLVGSWPECALVIVGAYGFSAVHYHHKYYHSRP